MLSSGNFTRHDLMPFKIIDLRQFLSRKNISTNQCTEKNDLVELVLRFSNSSQYFREQEEHRRHFEELQVRQYLFCVDLSDYCLHDYVQYQKGSIVRNRSYHVYRITRKTNYRLLTTLQLIIINLLYNVMYMQCVCLYLCIYLE